MSPRVAEPKDGKRTRNTREATRDRLLDAAIAVAKAQGAEGLSTVSITREASIVQSAFYHYFKDLDDCKRQAARRAGDRFRASVRAWRHDIAWDARIGSGLLADDFELLLGFLKTERYFVELLLQFRNDQSSMGDVIRGFVEEMRADYVEDLWWFAQQRGLTEAWRKRVAFSAALVFAMVFDCGDAFFSGRCTDMRFMAEELARNTTAIVTALFTEATAAAATTASKPKKRRPKRAPR